MLFKSIIQILKSNQMNKVNDMYINNSNQKFQKFNSNEINSTDLYAKSLFFVKPCYCF
ncbi:hypothetical protein RB653_002224 [Dictyostelium firmibasis]|uniref:Uncharacterized protein n=1 Tax=Dictyostelium firmibasis TaxID=79012 RepID=A0AAN7TXE6_9MYCE